MLRTFNKFLKTEHKIETLEELSPSELYLNNYKDNPRVDSYDTFISKVTSEFESMNNRKYKIIKSNRKIVTNRSIVGFRNSNGVPTINEVVKNDNPRNIMIKFFFTVNVFLFSNLSRFRF